MARLDGMRSTFSKKVACGPATVAIVPVVVVERKKGQEDRTGKQLSIKERNKEMDVEARSSLSTKIRFLHFADEGPFSFSHIRVRVCKKCAESDLGMLWSGSI